MVKSSELWCTHIAYLNDAQEYRYVADEYQRMLRDIANDTSLSRLQRRFASISAAYVDRDFNGFLEQQPPAHLRLGGRYFVASFSRDDDDLSQWRAYGGSGAKFALGFRVGVLRSLLSKFGFRFARVRYGFDDLEPYFLQQFLEHARRLEAQYTIDDSLEPVRGIVAGHQGIPASEFHAFNSRLIHGDDSALRKHAAFRGEEEWRLYGSFAAFVKGGSEVS